MKEKIKVTAKKIQNISKHIIHNREHKRAGHSLSQLVFVSTPPSPRPKFVSTECLPFTPVTPSSKQEKCGRVHHWPSDSSRHNTIDTIYATNSLLVSYIRTTIDADVELLGSRPRPAKMHSNGIIFVTVCDFEDVVVVDAVAESDFHSNLITELTPNDKGWKYGPGSAICRVWRQWKELQRNERPERN